MPTSWKSYTEGFATFLKDKHTGQLRKRILTDMGVRQGSVEEPACFSALYDKATWEVKTAGDRTAITAQQQGVGTEVNVSDLKFMDDLVSFCLSSGASKSMSTNSRCVLWLQVQGPRLEWHN